MSNDDRIDRRRVLLGSLIGGITAAIAGAVGAIFGRYLAGASDGRPRAGASDNSASASLGALADWAAGPAPVERTISFPSRDGYYVETRRERLFLFRNGSEPVVFSATCTHLGCAVSWEPSSRTFRCPCHGGVYGVDGRVVSGPPPRPLRRLPIEVRGGEVFVHTSDLA